ncbi:V-set and transmembrane domain-containing protein 4 isoform X4 [Triplophysa dalaica]|uniref:V-set and transmembrane domain-containing protein 4 isoform X4 n=1 Tax=Triplophysa dalaica TaxID=1582913 RepID=UPI0024DF8976|nr:V-set and transmembrane domain-containing protein 4 isoform X4 [Triplophysa dalaica]
MKISPVVIPFLTSLFFGNICSAINVTVIPSSFTVVAEGDNITLSCQVSQRRRSVSLPVVRWMFQPEWGGELLLARVNMRKEKFYGNYPKSFQKPQMKLTVVKQGKIYNLLIMNITEQDSGLYSCRVQEFKRHQERWKASNNSSASTKLRVHVFPADRPKEEMWSQLEDVYLCTVLVCCVGLLCMWMFTVAVSCQYLQRKEHLKAQVRQSRLLLVCLRLFPKKKESTRKRNAWSSQMCLQRYRLKSLFQMQCGCQSF